MKFGIKDIKEIVELAQKVLKMTSKEPSSKSTSSKSSELVESKSSPHISEDMTPKEEDELLMQRLINAASGCTPEQINTVIAMLESFKRR